MKEYKAESNVVVMKAYRNAYQTLGLSDADAARIIGKTSATLTLSDRFSTQSKEYEVQVEFVRLFRSLYAIFGGDTDAMKHWFTTDNKHLGVTPKELINKIVGLTYINDYLDAYSARHRPRK
jgi:regulator of protease activity HflC (stomatin/prohibitin superfamily)